MLKFWLCQKFHYFNGCVLSLYSSLILPNVKVLLKELFLLGCYKNNITFMGN